jgi:NADH dehydrogenase (ubiquinone) Fe-S protein 1
MYNQLKLIGALTSKPYAFTARSWELEKIDFIDFFDSLLSNIVFDVRGISVLRVVPRINEQLNEEWISDKIRFSYDGFRRQRIMYPLYKLDKNFVEVTWAESFFLFFFKYNLLNYDYINENSSSEFIFGKFMDLESTLSLKEFANSFKENKNYVKGIKSYKQDSYFSNEFLTADSVMKLSSLDLCVLIGVNLRFENPILHLKFLRASNYDKLAIFNFFGSNSNKFKSYNFGKNLINFFKFFEGRSKYSLFLSRANKPLVIVGESLRQRFDGKAFFRFFNGLKSKLNFLEVSPLFNDISTLSYNALFGNADDRKSNSNMLYLYNADELKLMKKYDLVVYQGSHGDLGAGFADLIFPSTFVIERKGNFLDLFGKIRNYRFVIKPSALIRTDWRIFRALSLFFENKTELEVYDFVNLGERLKYLLPVYPNGRLVSSEIKNKLQYSCLVFSNVAVFSSSIEYYTSDIVSRSSRIMSLSAVRFKNYFINF